MITMIAQQAWPREEREMIRTRVTRDKLNRFLYFTFCSINSKFRLRTKCRRAEHAGRSRIVTQSVKAQKGILTKHTRKCVGLGYVTTVTCGIL